MSGNLSLQAQTILVQPNRQKPRDAFAMAIWYTIAKDLQGLSLDYELADSVSWKGKLNTAYKTKVVFASLNDFEQAVQLSSELEIDITLIISPHSFPAWGKERWVSLLGPEEMDSIRIITDCEASRDLIDSALSNRRRTVEVVRPDYSLLYEGLDGCSIESLNGLRGLLLEEGSGFEQWTFGRLKSDFVNSFGHHSAGSEQRWREFGPADFPPNHQVESEFPLEEIESILQAFQLDELSNSGNRETISRLFSPSPLELQGIKLGIFGTKLSFIDELSRALVSVQGSRNVLDEWNSLSAPDEAQETQRLLRDSDVIIGEWARPNNVWIQERATSSKRLIVRAHRYEVTTDFPKNIDMDRYFAGVVIVPWVGRRLVQDFNWPSEKMVYIPNYVDSAHFSRQKLPNARFTLGLVGITPSLKRLDLALDILSELRAQDPRYVLRIRGGLPTEHLKWGVDPRIESQWGSVLERLHHDATIQGAVHFDPPGRDMARWLRQIGIILSTSDVEGSHVALAEGISSGALPVARRWPGIETLWPEEFIFDEFYDAVDWILQAQDEEWFNQTTERLRTHDSLNSSLIIDAWTKLIKGDLKGAQAVFGPIDWDASLFQRPNG